MVTKKKPKGRYVKAWAEVRKEEEMLWIEEGDDAADIVEHWATYGGALGYGFEEVEDDE